MSHEKDDVGGVGGEGRGGRGGGRGRDGSGDVLSPSAGEAPLSMRPLTSGAQEALTAAYLSVVGHDDQLHVLGGRLDVALVLRWGEGVGREGAGGTVDGRGWRKFKKEEDREGGQT